MLKSGSSKRVFVASLVGFLLIFYVLYGQEAVGFNFFSAWASKKNQSVGEWTTYAERVGVGSTEDAIVLGTTLANVKVGRGQRYGNSLIQRTLQELSKAQTLLTVDVIDLLAWASDRRAILLAYERNIEALTEEVAITYEWLVSTAQDRAADAQRCLEAKNEGDQRFYAGIQQYDPIEAEAGLEQATKEGPCYMSNRAQASAHDYLAQTLAVSNQLLTRRLQILQQNDENIIEYYPLLEDGTLTELQDVQYQLGVVNATSFSSVGNFFRWGIPQDTSGPQLLDIWFRGQAPGYLQGWYIPQ